MKSQWIKTFVAGLVVTCISLPVLAQQGESTGGVVAILDVAKVFKENPVFDAKMKEIKAQADALKMDIQKQQEVIRGEAAGLEQYAVGTPDRNNLEASLEQRQAALRTKARQAMRGRLAAGKSGPRHLEAMIKTDLVSRFPPFCLILF